MVPGLGSILAVEPLVALIEEELESPDAVKKGTSWEERPPREGIVIRHAGWIFTPIVFVHWGTAAFMAAIVELLRRGR